jgi:hypothetical protein
LFVTKMANAEIPMPEDVKTKRTFMKVFARPLRSHRIAPRKSSSTSLASLEGDVSGMVFASSSDISFGNEMDDDAALESDTNAPVGLPAMGEPLVLSTVLEVEEIPLPEELRAPVPHSPIWVPSPSPWPLEAGVASESVGLDLVDPPCVGLDMAEMEEFSLEDVLQIHPGRNEGPKNSNTICYLSGEKIHSWDLGPDESNHLGVIQNVARTLQSDGSFVWQSKNEHSNWQKAGASVDCSESKGRSGQNAADSGCSFEGSQV